VRVAQGDRQAGVDAQLGVPGQLRILVPGQGPAQLLGQRRDRRGDRVANRLPTAPSQPRAVVDPDPVAVSFHGGQGGTSMANRLVGSTSVPIAELAQAEDEVALPRSSNGAVGDLGRPLTERDLRAHDLLAPSPGTSPRHPQRPPGAQPRRQRTAQGAAALDLERLVDGLVGDPHRPIIGELNPQPVR
jgi:hypothetical protein